MGRIVGGAAKVALVCGFGLAGLIGGSAHGVSNTEPVHGIVCSLIGDCSHP